MHTPKRTGVDIHYTPSLHAIFIQLVDLYKEKPQSAHRSGPIINFAVVYKVKMETIKPNPELAF